MEPGGMKMVLEGRSRKRESWSHRLENVGNGAMFGVD